MSVSFAEFENATREQWLDATEASLRGAGLDSLVKPGTEGVHIHPLPHADDLARIQHHLSLPGQFPYVRGAKAAGYRARSWLIAAHIPHCDPRDFNRALREGLSQGQSAIALSDSLRLKNEADLRHALADIDLARRPLLILSHARAPAIYDWLRALCGEDALARLRGCLAYDPLCNLARTGAMPEDAFERLAAHLLLVDQHSPQLGSVGVCAAAYHDAGADATQELAATLATAVAYLRALSQRGLALADIAPKLHFRLNIGENFFIEVAKFRAVKLLWAQALRAFGLERCAGSMQVHARSGWRNKSRRDPYVNLLRLTTEALSAAVGGVDSIQLAAFDEPLGGSDDFSLGLSRNLQLILQEEVRLTELIDPAGGAWHVEKLTDQVARAAWSQFQRIEAAGGLLASLRAGTIQREIAAVASRRRRAAASGESVLVGSNRYVDPAADSPPAQTGVDAAEGCIRALKPIRLAEPLEAKASAR